MLDRAVAPSWPRDVGHGPPLVVARPGSDDRKATKDAWPATELLAVPEVDGGTTGTVTPARYGSVADRVIVPVPVSVWAHMYRLVSVGFGLVYVALSVTWPPMIAWGLLAVRVILLAVAWSLQVCGSMGPTTIIGCAVLPIVL